MKYSSNYEDLRQFRNAFRAFVMEYNNNPYRIERMSEINPTLLNTMMLYEIVSISKSFCNLLGKIDKSDPKITNFYRRLSDLLKIYNPKEFIVEEGVYHAGEYLGENHGAYNLVAISNDKPVPYIYFDEDILKIAKSLHIGFRRQTENIIKWAEKELNLE